MHINRRNLIFSFVFFVILFFISSNNSYGQSKNPSEKIFLEIKPVSISTSSKQNIKTLNKKNMEMQKDILILSQQVDILTKELNEVKMLNDVNYIKSTNKAIKRNEHLMIFLIVFMLITSIVIVTYTILLYLKIQTFLQKKLKKDVENVLKTARDDINKQFKERESKFALYIDKVVNKKIKILKDSLNETQEKKFDEIGKI